MNQPEPPSSSGFRSFAIGVVCVAVLLGTYFMRLNAEVDREREQVAERLAFCQHLESVTRVAASTNLESPEACKQLKKRYAESVAPL
ncbi:hypothetical protein ACQRBV_24560 [Pseudomonas sp. R11F]|uniref:Uncharacterized protein n=1 Tax=Pseudomonas palleroniana TaxID=191390 RepID=A0A109FP80_9PSED|nr:MULTISPECIES: hypothetical protein [Pseudomonas]RUP85403.1 hypothetical protein D8M20_13180 [Corynebacterium propinquum]AVE03375.1 hypothetical protein CYL20_01960 [Pseudomonas palleroniana]KWU47918.1 hypothetical protein AWV77_26765 [Pseudomonas palleroniana]MBM9485078.1 hypothetical protein [Pseudomonas sp. ICBG1301]UOK36552.1 hypothetical protein MJP36_18810 [Pseudomonas palleroniana]